MNSTWIISINKDYVLFSIQQLTQKEIMIHIKYLALDDHLFHILHQTDEPYVHHGCFKSLI